MRLPRSEKEWFENEMKVKSAMTRMPFTVAVDVPVQDARRMMKVLGVRHLPVLDRGELVGIVSDRDLRSAEAFQGPGGLTVGDAMVRDPCVVDPETPLSEVLGQMIERKIGSVLVRSPRGVAIGIFTAHDALQLLRAVILLGNREKEDAELFGKEPEGGRAA